MTDPVASFFAARRASLAGWLLDGEGGLVGDTLDLIKHMWLERLRLGHLARFPQQDADGTPGPSDALAALGRDRRVKRGINESDEAYARRLILWLDDRRKCGSPFALMKKLAEYCGPLPSFRTVDQRGNWFSRAADGTETYLLDQGNWVWDEDPSTKWSKFWVIIYPNGLWVDGPAWGDVGTEWGAGDYSWGSTATGEEVKTVRSIIQDWKPKNARCVNIIIAMDPASFDPSSPEPDSSWAKGSKNVGGVQVSSRLATARYWDGVR